MQDYWQHSCARPYFILLDFCKMYVTRSLQVPLTCKSSNFNLANVPCQIMPDNARKWPNGLHMQHCPRIPCTYPCRYNYYTRSYTSLIPRTSGLYDGPPPPTSRFFTLYGEKETASKSCLKGLGEKRQKKLWSQSWLHHCYAIEIATNPFLAIE